MLYHMCKRLFLSYLLMARPINMFHHTEKLPVLTLLNRFLKLNRKLKDSHHHKHNLVHTGVQDVLSRAETLRSLQTNHPTDPITHIHQWDRTDRDLLLMQRSRHATRVEDPVTLQGIAQIVL